MKKIFTILILLFSFNSLTQARIGYTTNEIVDEFKNNKLETGYPDNNWISVSLPICTAMYIFDENNVCFSTIIFPNEKTDLQYFINKYNEEYNKLNSDKWVQVNNGYNLYVDLLFDKDNQLFYFLWYK